MYLTQYYDLCHVLLRLANFCSIDLSKAFDKVNHYALFVKLTKRLFPVQLLDMLNYFLTGYPALSGTEFIPVCLLLYAWSSSKFSSIIYII